MGDATSAAPMWRPPPKSLAGTAADATAARWRTIHCRAALSDPAEVLPPEIPTVQASTASTVRSVAQAAAPTAARIEIVGEWPGGRGLHRPVPSGRSTSRTPKEDTIKERELRKVTVKRKGKLVRVTRSFTRLVDQDFTWKDPKGGGTSPHVNDGLRSPHIAARAYTLHWSRRRTRTMRRIAIDRYAAAESRGRIASRSFAVDIELGDIGFAARYSHDVNIGRTQRAESRWVTKALIAVDAAFRTADDRLR